MNNVIKYKLAVALADRCSYLIMSLSPGLREAILNDKQHYVEIAEQSTRRSNYCSTAAVVETVKSDKFIKE